MFRAGETVWLLRAGEQTGVDRYGKPVFGPPRRLPVRWCGVAPRMSQEPLEVGRQAVFTGLTVYMPPGTVVFASDELEIRGEAGWQVDGDPGDWRNPFTGRAHGVEVHVKRKEG